MHLSRHRSSPEYNQHSAQFSMITTQLRHVLAIATAIIAIAGVAQTRPMKDMVDDEGFKDLANQFKELEDTFMGDMEYDDSALQEELLAEGLNPNSLPDNFQNETSDEKDVDGHHVITHTNISHHKAANSESTDFSKSESVDGDDGYQSNHVSFNKFNFGEDGEDGQEAERVMKEQFQEMWDNVEQEMRAMGINHHKTGFPESENFL